MANEVAATIATTVDNPAAPTSTPVIDTALRPMMAALESWTPA